MIYTTSVTAKTGEEIPVFKSGKLAHSKYNPNGEKLLLNEDSEDGFFLIGGIAAGFHIKSLVDSLENKGKYFIIAFESDVESLNFCKNYPLVKNLSKNENIIFCEASQVAKNVLENYLPSLYGKFYLLLQRAWQNENTELCAKIQEIIKDVLLKVSSDFSVQSHFGKIWMHNILVNLRQLKKQDFPYIDIQNKKAAVIAAGPSLDKSIKQLNNKDFYIIATDTTTGSLIKNNINPDCIVAVDSQLVSIEHFYPLLKLKEQNKKVPLIFLDVSSSSSCINFLKKNDFPYYFIQSGHPLSVMAAKKISIPYIETGSGTVTIAACDIARKLGFTTIKLFGADFSYSNGKPYTKGTYLETRFSVNSSRMLPIEQQFSALMYRTELKKIKNDIFTTEVLQSYEKTLGDWAKRHNYIKNVDELISKNAEKCDRDNVISDDFNFKTFISYLLKNTQGTDSAEKMNYVCLLPYIAYLRRKDEYKESSFSELYRLALLNVAKYE